MTAIASPGDDGVPFRALFDAEYRYVHRVLRRLGVRDSDVEDVAHEVFLAVHGKFGQWDRSRPVRPWLFGFAFHAASSWRRSRRHRVEQGGDDVDGIADGLPADEAMARADEARLVALALESVDFERRAILVAHELEEIPVKEIAVTFQLPINTVYSRLRVGRQEFADAVTRIRLRRGER
ncbi:MAG: sigma-70 family RNA polymerase sigma factor [Polyangiaceae bacterium]